MRGPYQPASSLGGLVRDLQRLLSSSSNVLRQGRSVDFAFPCLQKEAQLFMGLPSLCTPPPLLSLQIRTAISEDCPALKKLMKLQTPPRLI